MGILRLLFVCFFCTYGYGFPSGGKGSGMKVCTLVRLLSGMTLSHCGELGLAWSHGGGITSKMYASTHWCHAAAPGEAQWAVGIGGGSVA